MPGRLIKFLFITLVFTFTAGLAQAVEIDKVIIEGNRRIPKETFRKHTVKAGDEFSVKAIDESIKKLYRTDLVSDVQVDLGLDDDKTTITYIVKERPYVNNVYIEGNSDVKSRVLREELAPMEGELYSVGTVRANIAKLIDFYREENYYNVKILSDIEDRGNNSVDVVFNIEEGVEAKIYDIEFIGNEHFDDDDLEDTIQTNEKGFWSWISGSGKLKRNELSNDLDRIRMKYMNTGFAYAQVGEPEIILDDSKKRIRLVFRIVEGDRFKIGSVTFEGHEHVETEELQEAVQLKTGDWFSSEKFQNDIKRLTDEFTRIGYAFANVDPATKADKENNLINLTYTIEENILVYINRINIRGNKDTRDRVIRRQFDIHEGDLYNSKLLDEAKNNLQYTDYFSKVQMAETKIAEDQVNVDLEVEDKATGMFTVGAGYSTVEYLSLMAQVKKQNLWGKGYELAFKAEFTSKRTDYTLSFTNPWLYDRPISVGFDILKSDTDYYEYEKELNAVSLRAGHQPIKRHLFVNYRLGYQQKNIYNLDDDASYYVELERGHTTSLFFTPSVTWRTTNHPIVPTEGNLSRAFVKYAGGVLGGDEDYYKGGLETSQYTPLFWKFIWMIHGEIGYVEAFDGDRIPIDERYRLGGINSLRGFSNGKITPRDADGYAYGGDKYVLMNNEIQFPISEEANLRGVLFVDVGQVYDNNEDYFSYETRESAGGGFRWYSPIGPLRFEYGKVLDKKRNESGDRWDFSIGGMF